MKNILMIAALLLLSSCTSIRIVDSWKNEDVLWFKPQKLLIVGMTDNLTARKIFESKLKSSFLARNINAYESSEIIELTFTDSRKSEEEINAMTKDLSEQGFDAILISAVRGVDDRRNYSRGYYTVDYRWQRFGRYYYRFQDIYYNPSYYRDYKVYHVETSIYNINEDDDKSLIWVGALDLIDPQDITRTIDGYVTAIVDRLESEGLITKR